MSKNVRHNIESDSMGEKQWHTYVHTHTSSLTHFHISTGTHSLVGLQCNFHRERKWNGTGTGNPLLHGETTTPMGTPQKYINLLYGVGSPLGKLWWNETQHSWPLFPEQGVKCGPKPIFDLSGKDHSSNMDLVLSLQWDFCEEEKKWLVLFKNDRRRCLVVFGITLTCW